MTTQRKTPQDRKPKAEDVTAEKAVQFEDIEGSHLLIPFDQVKGSDQLRLMSKLKDLGLMDDDGEADGEMAVVDMPLEELADLIDWVAEKFAVNQDAFDAFTAGHGGHERALNLAIAYCGALGESDSSES